ncbi:MAG TPA: hypothetical protein VMT90_01075 [Dehalococcoidia bacterium]|jgi:hypothetical protein|nr:hypothetical protein [Dehalococcoidia bacterium]
MAARRSTLLEPVNTLEAVKQAWNYPVFDAIFQRRARRFPLGATMPGDLAPFTSAKEPVPLDEIEEAMLVMAGTGISGTNLADLPYDEKGGANFCGNTMLQFVGRVYASACGSHGTELFFTNDEGTYMVQFRDKTPEAVQEFASLDDREKIIQSFRANTVKLSDGRLSIPMLPGVTQPFNWWNANQPGTTLFMPITDATWEYINVLMLLMDEPNSYYPYDDLNDNAEPLKEWADKGHLDRTRAYPLSQLESNMRMITSGTEQAIMLQNMYLALQAMGLGGWIFSSSVGQYILAAMGFRFETPAVEGPIRPLIPGPRLSCVGLDGVFQAYCPPYYPDMGAAVQAIYDAKWGRRGIYKEEGGPVALKDRQSLDKLVSKTPDWCLEASKAFADYIWKTYGRFPATIDPMEMNIWFQAHHLETEFYDRYYQPGAYHQAVKDHMAVWHGSH